MKTERRRPSESQGERSQKKAVLPTPCSHSFSLWNCEEMRFYCVSPTVRGTLLPQPKQTAESYGLYIFYCKCPSALDFCVLNPTLSPLRGWSSRLAGLQPNGTLLPLPGGERGCFSGPPASATSSRSSLEPFGDSRPRGPASTQLYVYPIDPLL